MQKFQIILSFLPSIMSIPFYNSFMSKLRPLECNSINAPICLNGGLCVDWSKFGDNRLSHQSCQCQEGFFGPHCEYSTSTLFDLNDDHLDLDAIKKSREIRDTRRKVTKKRHVKKVTKIARYVTDFNNRKNARDEGRKVATFMSNL